MSHPVARLLQKITSRFFKLRPRTRSILVVLGCMAMATSWFLPWYEVVYWLSPHGFQAAMRTGRYEAVAELDGFSAQTAKYGDNNIAQIGYSGSDLSHAGAATHALGLSSAVFTSFLVLGGLALLVVWTDEWRSSTGVARYLKRAVDYSAWLGLLAEVFWCVWRAADTTSLTVVDKAATALMVKDLGGGARGAAGVVYVDPGLSVGYLSLLLGLVLFAIAVMTGSKSEPPEDSGTPALRATRITAGTCVVVGLVYLAATFALFGS